MKVRVGVGVAFWSGARVGRTMVRVGVTVIVGVALGDCEIQEVTSSNATTAKVSAPIIRCFTKTPPAYARCVFLDQNTSYHNGELLRNC